MLSDPPLPGFRPPPGYDPTDLSMPLYGADVGQAFVRFWRKYLVLSGRASQSEFWWWALMSTGISVFVNPISLTVFGSYPQVPTFTPAADPWAYYHRLLDYDLRTSLGALVWLVATLVGQIALGVRRLHDTDRSGWWYLVVLVPLVGWVVLVVLLAKPAQPGGQRFDA